MLMFLYFFTQKIHYIERNDNDGQAGLAVRLPQKILNLSNPKWWMVKSNSAEMESEHREEQNTATHFARHANASSFYLAYEELYLKKTKKDKQWNRAFRFDGPQYETST